MRAKKGNLLHKKGKVLHPASDGTPSDICYATMIADALHEELARTRSGAKTVMQWTGASERTVKHWFAGTSAPSGQHLITLVRYSDSVLQGLLKLSGRELAVPCVELVEVRRKLRELCELIDKLTGEAR